MGQVAVWLPLGRGQHIRHRTVSCQATAVCYTDCVVDLGQQQAGQRMSIGLCNSVKDNRMTSLSNTDRRHTAHQQLAPHAVEDYAAANRQLSGQTTAARSAHLFRTGRDQQFAVAAIHPSPEGPQYVHRHQSLHSTGQGEGDTSGIRMKVLV